MHRVAQPEFGIHGVDAARLGLLLDALAHRGCKFLSLDDVVNVCSRRESPPERAVAFTVDDGYADQAEVIAPLFVERGIPLTIFLITGMIDGKSWPWDAKIAYAFECLDSRRLTLRLGRLNLEFDVSDDRRRRASRRECQAMAKTMRPDHLAQFIESIYEAAELLLPAEAPEQFRPMTWDMARDLERQGVRFGPHTVTHSILSRQDAESASNEMSESWARISAELETPARVIAWPVGGVRDFGDREIETARRLDFLGAMAALGNYSRVDEDGAQFRLDRFGLPSGEDLVQTFRIVSGLTSLKELALRRSVSPTRADYQPDTTSREGGHGLRVGVRVALSRAAAVLGLYRPPDPSLLSAVDRIVFVCQGNICRSPYAEVVARSLGLRAVSCGLQANRIATADPMAARVAFARGHDLSHHRSRPLDEVELRPTDLLLAMEPSQLAKLRTIADQAGSRCSLAGLWARPRSPWIADPFGCGPETFDKAFMTIDDAMSRLAAEFQECGRLKVGGN